METSRTIAEACRRTGRTVAVAESCTGGLVASALTEIPGASAWFRGGVVTYATDTKHSVLGVSDELLRADGPVCAATAQGMAEGVRRLLGADVSVSVTGLAGPDGDPNRAIPVGTVFIGWATASASGAEPHRFEGDREAVRHQAREAALARILALLEES